MLFTHRRCTRRVDNGVRFDAVNKFNYYANFSRVAVKSSGSRFGRTVLFLKMESAAMLSVQEIVRIALAEHEIRGHGMYSERTGGTS